MGLLNSRTGKRITMADLDYYHTLEEEKEEEIKKVRNTHTVCSIMNNDHHKSFQIRLNNIKLAAKMSKLSESLRQKVKIVTRCSSPCALILCHM